MKIVHSISSLDKQSGGPSNSVSNLSDSLCLAGLNSAIHTLDTGNEVVDTDCPTTFHPVLLSRRLGHSPSLRRAMLSALGEADILHNHGLWMLPNIYPGHVKKRTSCKLILAPRGTLTPWSLQQSKWKKKLVYALGQKGVLRQTDCFHVTAEKEYEDIRRLGFRQAIALIPNGIHMPDPGNSNGKREKLIVYLGRIHPQKGIERLLNIWPAVSEKRPGWKLLLCGPGDPDYLASVETRIQTIGDSISCPGPLWGDEKSKLLFRSSVFILPSESENFGISVAEALAHGVPAIVSREAPWRGLVDRECGWWVPNHDSDYMEAMLNATSLDSDELVRMGIRGAEWMARDFSWASIGAAMAQTYQWLQGQADRPDCIRLD